MRTTRRTWRMPITVLLLIVGVTPGLLAAAECLAMDGCAMPMASMAHCQPEQAWTADCCDVTELDLDRTAVRTKPRATQACTFGSGVCRPEASEDRTVAPLQMGPAPERPVPILTLVSSLLI